jgi:hypothetical protein
MYDYRVTQGNPFAGFLKAASKMLNIAGSSEPIDASDRSAYARNADERNFCEDVCDRIQRMAFAYDRLCELSIEYWKMSDELDQNRDENGRCEIAPQMLQAQERWDLESDSLTFYIYYELKSVADILEQWTIVPPANSALEYALKARDRFLAHPEFCRIGPRSNRSKVLPRGPAPAFSHIASLQGWETIVRDEYLAQLQITTTYDINQEATKNRRILLSRQRNEKLSSEEVLRVKAFGAPEPDLGRALKELAVLLDSSALPKIATVSAEAVNRFGFEEIPDGPFFSHRF